MTARFIDQTPFVPLLPTGGGVVEVAHPSRQPGDLLVAIYVLHDATASAVPLPSRPPDWTDGPGTSSDPTSTLAFSDNKGRVGLFFQVVTMANIDVTSTAFLRPGGPFANPTASTWAVSIVCLRGVALNGDTFLYDGFVRSAQQTTDPGMLAGRQSSPWPTRSSSPSPPPTSRRSDSSSADAVGYHSERETHNSFNRGASSIIYTQAVSASVAAVSPAIFSIPNDPITGYAVFGFALRPAPPVVSTRPATAATANLRLDCAESYEVFITSRDYTTVIDAVPYSSLSWQRILDDVERSQSGGAGSSRRAAVRRRLRRARAVALRDPHRTQQPRGVVGARSSASSVVTAPPATSTP